MRLTVPADVIQQIVSHARLCLPQEACGFLVGRAGTADRFLPTPNALRSETAYAVAPRILFDLFRELRRSGEELVAICHSHPSGPPVPSERDVREAQYPDCAYLIVSLSAQEPELRAYRIVGEEVIEMELHAIV